MDWWKLSDIGALDLDPPLEHGFALQFLLESLWPLSRRFDAVLRQFAHQSLTLPRDHPSRALLPALNWCVVDLLLTTYT